VWGGEHFTNYRLSTIIAALVIIVITAGLYFVAEAVFTPSRTLNITVAESGDRVLHVVEKAPKAYTAVQNVLSVVLSIALISLVYEVFLRRRYAEDLLRFLNLKGSTVASGLQAIDRDVGFDWAGFLHGATDVKIVVRDPNRVSNVWPLLLQEQKTNAVSVTFALPDPDGSQDFLGGAGRAVGLTADDLAAQSRLWSRMIEEQWTHLEAELKPGASIRILHYSTHATYDVYAADGKLAVILGPAFTHTLADSGVVLYFDGDESRSFPSSLIRPQAADPPGASPHFQKTAGGGP
jgi:hypothetical protein